MLRKQLLRQARNISESFTSTSLPQTSLVRRSAPFSSASFVPTTRVVVPTYRSSQTLGRRWQSTDSDKKNGNAPTSSDAASSEAKSDPATPEDPIKLELEKKNKEVIDLKDKYLRSVADYRNLQDRTKRDMDSAKQFAIQRFAADLLDSIDNLDRALVSVPKESIAESSSSSEVDHKKDLFNLYSGLKMTEEILLGTLKKHGLERFDPTEGEGRKFDPNTDEATFFTTVEGKQDGDVFFVQSKGFKLNGRVIRAAKVGVVKNS